MGDPARVRGVGRVLLAGDLFSGRRIPKAELRRDSSAVRSQQPSGQYELGVGPLPCVHIGRRIRIGDRFRKIGRVERQKEDRAGEIRRHDRTDLVVRLFAGERRHRDGYGFEVGARVDIDVACGDRRRPAQRGERRPRGPRAPRRRKRTKDHLAISRDKIDGSPATLFGGDLRIEVDGLRLPLLIKRAILRRHWKRVAILHRGHHAFGLRLSSGVRRRVDELGGLASEPSGLNARRTWAT